MPIGMRSVWSSVQPARARSVTKTRAVTSSVAVLRRWMTSCLMDLTSAGQQPAAGDLALPDHHVQVSTVGPRLEVRPCMGESGRVVHEVRGSAHEDAPA